MVGVLCRYSLGLVHLWRLLDSGGTRTQHSSLGLFNVRFSCQTSPHPLFQRWIRSPFCRGFRKSFLTSAAPPPHFRSGAELCDAMWHRWPQRQWAVDGGLLKGKSLALLSLCPRVGTREVLNSHLRPTLRAPTLSPSLLLLQTLCKLWTAPQPSSRWAGATP